MLLACDTASRLGLTASFISETMLTIIIPPVSGIRSIPVYEVYRGYIVFAFSVCVCVSLCVNFFFVKDFSGTTVPRILKFGTKIGYDKLYCV